MHVLLKRASQHWKLHRGSAIAPASVKAQEQPICLCYFYKPAHYLIAQLKTRNLSIVTKRSSFYRKNAWSSDAVSMTECPAKGKTKLVANVPHALTSAAVTCYWTQSLISETIHINTSKLGGLPTLTGSLSNSLACQTC